MESQNLFGVCLMLNNESLQQKLLYIFILENYFNIFKLYSYKFAEYENQVIHCKFIIKVYKKNKYKQSE